MTIVPRTQLPLLVCALIPADSTTDAVLGALGCRIQRGRKGNVVGRFENVTVLPVFHNDIDVHMILASDGVVLVIDGNQGVSPAVIDTWRELKDWDVPRHLGVLNSVTGRADFDEVIAIGERVLDDAMMVRYLPVENDASDGVDGMYDILTSELHVLSTEGISIRSSDPEHVALTADKREVLIEDIAHHSQSDVLFDALTTGMPMSIPALEAAWNTPGIVSATPLDDNVGVNVLAAWYATLDARWLPTVNQGDVTFSVDETSDSLGIGIAKNMARVWNNNRQTWFERVHGKHSPVTTDDCNVLGAVCFAVGIAAGDTLRPQHSDYLVREPRF